MQLSSKLDVHALAIAQVAGLISKFSWSIEEFINIYDRNTRKITGPNGKTTLDTVWKLSFESLGNSCKALLGVLAYIMPDDIPQALFEMSDSTKLPERLLFCHDEFE